MGSFEYLTSLGLGGVDGSLLFARLGLALVSCVSDTLIHSLTCGLKVTQVAAEEVVHCLEAVNRL